MFDKLQLKSDVNMMSESPGEVQPGTGQDKEVEEEDKAASERSGFLTRLARLVWRHSGHVYWVAQLKQPNNQQAVSHLYATDNSRKVRSRSAGVEDSRHILSVDLIDFYTHRRNELISTEREKEDVRV